jgi:hypothetical protein
VSFASTSTESDPDCPSVLDSVEFADTTDSHVSSPVDYYSELQKKIALIVLKHRELGLIPKSTMEHIVNDMRDVLKFAQMAFIQSFSNGDQSLSINEIDVEQFGEQNEFILHEIFQNVSTSKQLRSYCSRYLGMVKPQEIVLDRYSQNGKSKKNSFQYVSVIETLRVFLAHEDVAAEIVKECARGEADMLRSYKDGSACKQSALFCDNNMALRLHFYIDDFEVCNPIGSRTSLHKLMAVYYVVGNVHPKYWSQTSGIHLAALHGTN